MLNRAFLVRVVKTSDQSTSAANVKRLNLTAPQVKQIALGVGAVYTYVIVLHTVRDIALIAARAKLK